MRLRSAMLTNSNLPCTALFECRADVDDGSSTDGTTRMLRANTALAAPATK